MKAFHSIQKIHLNTSAVFEIQLQNHENVYMSVSKSNYMNDERCVVVVDAKKFLRLWRNNPYKKHSDISKGNIETWQNDSKYHYAVEGFSHGINNPVPVAEIVYQEHTNSTPVYRRKYLILKELVKVEEVIFDYVVFRNGITRTIWLLVNGAEYFPVECPIKSAGRLAEIASYAGNEYRTVEQLTTNIISVMSLENSRQGKSK
jgi:hypothetical protein